jgi:hypothetical protein
LSVFSLTKGVLTRFERRLTICLNFSKIPNWVSE